MKLLAIDTSTERLSVALHFEGRNYLEEYLESQQHAEYVLPLIEKLLAESGSSMKQLDAIVFGQGPGSFTGLRIACSVAKGLAYAHDLPLYPVSTLEAIAHEFWHENPLFCNYNVLSMMDARMNQVYWSCILADHKTATTAQVSFISEIELPVDALWVLAGVGFENYRSQMPLTLSTGITNFVEVYPKASALIRMVLQGLIEPVTAKDALPVYIRNQVTQGLTDG